MNREGSPFLAEMLGTFGFVLIGSGVFAINNQTGGSLGIVGIALANGLALAGVIYAFSHVSVAHFNPAVTISLWLTKRIDGITTTWYVVSQLIGAVVAAIIIEGLFGGVRQTVPEFINLGVFSAILVEAIFTFILVLIIYGTLVDKRAHTSHAGLAIGLVYAACITIGLSLTGGVLNPAKAFGPAFVANFWTNQIVYWVGPILGAALAALVYEHGIIKSGN